MSLGQMLKSKVALLCQLYVLTAMALVVVAAVPPFQPVREEWLHPASWSKRTTTSATVADTLPTIHLSHRHLCESRKVDVTLNPEDDEFEYMPRVYSEIRCKNRLISSANVFVDRTNGKCAELQMECVQQYRLMTIMQRRKDDQNACWEAAHFEIVVPHGCECMSPQRDKFNRNL